MNKTDILSECNKVFIDQLDNSAILLTHETVADDIDEWDSLAHIQLITAIEKHFGIKFTTAEMNSFENVGEMCDMIEKKIISKVQ